jgi:hypothetical protein
MATASQTVAILTCVWCAIRLNYCAKAVCVQSELPKNLVKRHWKVLATPTSG